MHVVDAKSVYDTLQKEGAAGSKDRRTTLELAIVATALEKAQRVMSAIQCKVLDLHHAAKGTAREEVQEGESRAVSPVPLSRNKTKK